MTGTITVRTTTRTTNTDNIVTVTPLTTLQYLIASPIFLESVILKFLAHPIEHEFEAS